MITAQSLRDKYLKFFESKGHVIIPSAPVVPQNDASVLFTTAGMHPLVPYLLGEKHPNGTRLVDAQKCIRTTDIDDVGDNRHLTFFEMLGNWSLGDYFKEEAISWSFEFLTSEQGLNLDPATLYVSVFAGDADVPRDDEAINAWKKAFRSHQQKPIEGEFSEDIYAINGNNKIFAYNREKNWWQAGETGPAGPDSEMFIDTEPVEEIRVSHKKWQQKTGSDEKCHINCDCGRFIEIWNDVFMQFNGLGGGKYEPLAQKNVDTGMGLERVVAFLNGQKSVFDTELFKGAFDIILEQVNELTNEQEEKARIIVDHIKASTFIINDGTVPSNKERGYVLRRLLRRAMIHGRILGLSGPWIEKMIKQYIELYSQAYPDLKENEENILKTVSEEEQKFGKTLEQGLKEFRKYKTVSGTDAFNLFQSFGIPWEITKELAEDIGIKIDKKEFEEEFKKHQELSRTASAGTFKGGLADHSEKVVRLHTATHLMNAALRKVLGDQVYQKGSNITTERTRFDFTHTEKMTAEQIKQAEELVNEWINKDLEVKKEVMPLEKARELGAIGVFGEKYGDTVSIYTIMDKEGNVYSREFCGGPHVEHTGVIGKFKIAKEEASSQGVRRIKATIDP